MFLAIILAGLLLTPAYAARIPSVAVKRLGGTGPLSVSSPTGATVVANPYSFNTSSQVTAYRITWTPAATGNYTIQVVLKDLSGTVLGQGTAVVSVTSTAPRIDPVSLTTPVSIAQVRFTRVNIAKQ
uniref:Uncharacterized protein n=1 Tax=uncultured prokaryote TaxID=198431 RepID=H5SLF9_9ZZZZ|nr:hypothetical protein HGMM_F46A05C34 [uncultured prokaryote]